MLSTVNGRLATPVQVATLNKRTMKIRVLLADGHDEFRDALRTALECEAGMEVVAQTRSDQAAMAAMRSIPVDVVCLDMRIAALGGIEATRLLLQRSPQTRVIGLSIHDDPALVHAMIDAGASGFVLKMDAGSDLALAIRSVHDNETFLSHSMTRIAAIHSRGSTPID